MKLNRIAATAAAMATVATAFATLPASASANPHCTPAHLRLSLGHQRAATGHVTLTLTARNNGPACVLSGFPRLGLEDARGNALHSTVTRTGKAGSVLVLNGLTAQAGVSYGSDGVTGERAAFLVVGAKRVPFPGGPALVYGGHVTETSWVLPKHQ